MTSPVILDPATGELLDGRYRLVERVGEGGMARVYRAEDLHLQRTVAAKVMRGPADELGSVERARTETTLLASLNHPALVTLYDAHLSRDDISFLVMEFVDGITLRDLIAQGPLEPRLAASLAADLGEALHVAHAAGIVHRDIKPSNVLLSRSPVPGSTWRPKLADFGIAYLHDSTRVTTPGLMVGTIAYLAPEQADGAPPAPPADIYSFGIMLIEALSGAKPFPHAEGIAALVARMTTPPPIPASLPEEWRRLLRGMTASRPEDRPTALEVSATAARLAGRADTSTVALLESTLATGATVPLGTAAAGAGRVPAPADQAERTAVLPPLPPLPLLPPEVATADADDRAPARRTLGPRRIAIGAVASVALLLAVAAGLFGVWSGATTADPAPSPTPSVAASQPAETPAPVETTAPETSTTTTTGTGGGSSGGSGGGNSNSGPGNNNGNGNGNGNGNAGGNGKGNGNG